MTPAQATGASTSGAQEGHTSRRLGRWATACEPLALLCCCVRAGSWRLPCAAPCRAQSRRASACILPRAPRRRAHPPARRPAPKVEGPNGWEQSEEVARRLLEDMAAAEAREAAQRQRDKAEGRAVAEAHRAGATVSRAWEQEEEVYRRLASEMAALEKRGFPFTASRTNLATPSMPPKLAPGATPPLPPLASVPRPVPMNRTPSVQAALDHPSWEQEEARLPRAPQHLTLQRAAVADYSFLSVHRRFTTAWPLSLRSWSRAGLARANRRQRQSGFPKVRPR